MLCCALGPSTTLRASTLENSLRPTRWQGKTGLQHVVNVILFVLVFNRLTTLTPTPNKSLSRQQIAVGSSGKSCVPSEGAREHKCVTNWLSCYGTHGILVTFVLSGVFVVEFLVAGWPQESYADPSSRTHVRRYFLTVFATRCNGVKAP